LYAIFDLAAEYWKTPFVFNTLSKMSKKELTFWLAYRELRHELEQKKINEASRR
jgi:hypothetical protein